MLEKCVACKKIALSGFGLRGAECGLGEEELGVAKKKGQKDL